MGATQAFPLTLCSPRLDHLRSTACTKSTTKKPPAYLVQSIVDCQIYFASCRNINRWVNDSFSRTGGSSKSTASFCLLVQRGTIEVPCPLTSIQPLVDRRRAASRLVCNICIVSSSHAVKQITCTRTTFKFGLGIRVVAASRITAMQFSAEVAELPFNFPQIWSATTETPLCSCSKHPYSEIWPSSFNATR